ncbi:penicillin-binding protein 2A [Evansella vedderi]|uniref:Penicillin-binding protein 2A n=1 Tax=Evansella vedderi TaxID=38282 RepID=A0ABT9ZVS7_9BACI|nr:PBP1A family penicillin-binding protein [Evansella vedderi]MDQ0254230.1 penicillin-binding protein 2A [Evansella vedderi]
MSKKRILFGSAFIAAIFVFGFIVYLGIILFGNYAIDNKELVMNAASTVETGDGDLITRLYFENRDIVSLDEIPEHVQHAFLAVEDHRFFSHQGIDFRAIGRALYRDILAGSKVEGGSTITQQLAKNVFLTHDKTWLRKTKEVLIAINLEYRYSKEDILEMYLNRIYFGHGAHGIQAASQLYFDKPVSELSTEEGALIAALPKAPNYYSPMRNPEESKERRNLVLGLMERRGYLSAEEAVRLQGRTIPTTFAQVTENPAYLSYVDLVLDEGERVYNISKDEILKGGYRIVVEMDPHLQEKTYDAFQDSNNFPAPLGENHVEGSIVLLDHQTGGVVAVQGGRYYVQQGFNRAIAKRQPGSILKPMAVFAPALESGNYHPYSLLTDELIDYNGYSPRNYNHQYSGEITMYDALKDSANAPAVWLLNELGIDLVVDSLKAQNIEINEPGLALALGGLHDGVSPLQMAAAYGTFANGGIYREPYFIKEIYDRNGNLVAERKGIEEQVLSPQTAWYMTRMLEAVVKEGTGASGIYDGPLAGKTGTTSFEGITGANRDIWFAGYTPELSGAIWMGYDRTDEDNYLTASSSLPTKLFKDILTVGKTEMDQNIAFEVPDGVTDLEEPIRFVGIKDLTADVSLGLRGATVHLQWSGSADDRLHYVIYEKKEDGIQKVGEVVGEHEYRITGKNIFSQNAYVVVPYSPQIEREGLPSNVVEARFRLFSQDDNAS